jgi:hypothetical protein
MERREAHPFLFCAAPRFRDAGASRRSIAAFSFGAGPRFSARLLACPSGFLPYEPARPSTVSELLAGGS